MAFTAECGAICWGGGPGGPTVATGSAGGTVVADCGGPWCGNGGGRLVKGGGANGPFKYPGYIGCVMFGGGCI